MITLINTTSGPDCLKELVPKVGLRMKVYKLIKHFCDKDDCVRLWIVFTVCSARKQYNLFHCLGMKCSACVCVCVCLLSLQIVCLLANYSYYFKVKILKELWFLSFWVLWVIAAISYIKTVLVHSEMVTPSNYCHN